MSGINADPSDPDRTHGQVTNYYRYGFEGHVERGVATLMRQAQVSNTNCTPHVQAVGVLRDVIAALRACGESPEDAWRQALAHRDVAASQGTRPGQESDHG